MEKRRLVLGIVLSVLVASLLAGCGQKQPDIVCNDPYIRHANSCCMDRNDNKVCDDDEDVMFQPTYIETDEDYGDEFVEPDYQVLEPEPAKTAEPAKTTAPETKTVVEEEAAPAPKYTSKYVQPEVKPYQWFDETDYMSLEVTGIEFQIVSVKPKDLISPDKVYYLKSMKLKVKNKVTYDSSYVYIHPKFSIDLYDSFDNYLSEKLLCDASDDILMSGCEKALEQGQEMTINMEINAKLSRPEVQKTLVLRLENRRDSKTANVLEIKKTFDIRNLAGATYS